MRSFIVGLDPGEVARLARLSAAIGFPVGVLPGLDALRLELARPGWAAPSCSWRIWA